jgi:exodeoxyribonuclease VII small subunit
MAEQTQSYQKMSAELNALLTELQSGDLDIDEAVKKYQRGMEIVKELQKYLKDAENKVKKVKADFSS